ncbi:hypothetical protein DBV05_g11034 [Lasiodiplodia theobromae]|uniref:Uncharacterized protein n=1 Tax=Lasiodiplodia theobromae TaxID=45133 RepID=A0A5N5CYB6_9PEZI|nr:hypothetical protein DBV05_g11034 [Lasiodiplodia theobromae]
MNLYFTPSFILLPLSQMIGSTEIGVLIGVFIIGYILQLALTAYASRAIQFLLRKFHLSKGLPSQAPGTSSSDTSQDASAEGSSSGKPETGLPCSERPSDIDSRTSSPNEPSAVLVATKRLADAIPKYIDIGTYLCLFIFIGIPVYYSTGYTMPIFLSFNVLMFFGANSIPSKIRRVAHPVIITALFSVLGIWVIALTQNMSLEDGLSLYKIDSNYLQYFRGTAGLPLPGAGDILSSLLDASIVSLAMPMFQHRNDLRRVTLALAQLSAENLGGDTSAISPIAVVSGISGPIFGPTILRLLRIPKGM